MKSNLFKILAVFFALSIFALNSCEKPDPDAQSAEDDARGSYIMADAFAVANNEAGGGGKALLEKCYTVNRDFQDTIVIDFTECTNRNGRMIVAYSVPFPNTPIAVSTVITFENYTVDGIAVEGTITSTFGGTLLIPEINVVASGMKATFPTGKILTWNSNQTHKILTGFGDRDLTTNIVEMSGTSSGVNRAGLAFSSVYNTVRTEGSCDSGYPVSGTVTIESDKGTTVIDYGEGTCDNKIVVTNDGVSVSITLE